MYSSQALANVDDGSGSDDPLCSYFLVVSEVVDELLVASGGS